MRRLILNIHLYAGLLCSPYLIIFGISSLNFNHHFVEPGDRRTTWTAPLTLDPSIEKRALGVAVRDSLDLMGWGPWWKVERDSLVASVEVVRPGKRYNITIAEGVAKVEEVHLGAWQVVSSLHALTDLPRSSFVGTEICTWAVLFSAASGIYLMTARKEEQRIGWTVFVTASVASLGLFVYVLVVG